MKVPHPIRSRRARKELAAYEAQIRRASAAKRRIKELPGPPGSGNAEKKEEGK